MKLDRKVSNHPAPGKAGIAPPLTIEHHRPGLPDPGRSTKCHHMKALFLSLCTSGVLFSFAASADTLNLTDPSGIPVPLGTHVDSSLFPALFFDWNPSGLTSLTLVYDANLLGAGHEMESATLLFDPSQVASIDEVFTPIWYRASVTFSVPITAVSDELAPAFWAVHKDFTDPMNGGRWTGYHLDGSGPGQVGFGYVVPEPSTASLFVLSGILTFTGYRCRTIRLQARPGSRLR